MIYWLFKPFGELAAFFKPSIISSIVSDFTSKIWQRDRIAGFIEWKGFEVVHPATISKPFSIYDNKSSCRALFNRWISSMIINKPLDSLASSIIIFISFLFPVEALKKRQGILRSLAKAFAIVVFPQPGFPYKIIENGCFFSTIFVKIESLPTKCCWPITSLKFWGRIRFARVDIILSSFRFKNQL